MKVEMDFEELWMGNSRWGK